MIGYLPANYSLIHAFQAPTARRTRRESAAVGRVFKHAPKLADFLPEEETLAVRGSLDRPISGLTVDGYRVAPGMVYFAVPDSRGRASSLDTALSRGAVAVVTDTLPAVPAGKTTFVVVKDVRVALARVAQRYYGLPDRAMTVVGVAGSTGQTAVAFLLKHFLQGDQRVGLISSVHYDLGTRTVPSFQPTPPAPDIHGMLAQMRDAGCRQAVLEVSDQGLNEQRVHGLSLGAAIFTNFGRADEDSPDASADRLARIHSLFTGGMAPVPKVSVVNLDDAEGARLARRLGESVPETRVITFGLNPAATVRADDVVFGPDRTRLRLSWPGGSMDLETYLLGPKNLAYLLAAVGTAWGLGRDPVVFLARLRAFPGAPGSLERVVAGQPFNLVVDSARTEASLGETISFLRSMTKGRLIVVFGCRGGGDRATRAPLSRTAEAGADVVVATADNPRAEPLAQIFTDMRAGVSRPEKFAWIEDRRKAISLAMDLAKAGDCVLIAGKGQDLVQECADTVFPFDDRQVAREIIVQKGLKG